LNLTVGTTLKVITSIFPAFDNGDESILKNDEYKMMKYGFNDAFLAHYKFITEKSLLTQG
jgi:hypothetical protein